MVHKSLIKPSFTAAEIVAIHRFAREHGRYWKQALREEWRRGCVRLPELVNGSPYRAVILRLLERWDFGLRGLGTFRLRRRPKPGAGHDPMTSQPDPSDGGEE